MDTERDGSAGVALTWLGPFSLLPNNESNPAIFDEPQAQNPGVYLWTVAVNGFLHVNYVGMTPHSMSDRQEEHLREYMAGRYVIHAPGAYGRGQLEAVYKPTRSLQPFLMRYTELSVALVEQLGHIKVYFAAVSGRDKRTLERIESALIEHVRDTQKSGSAFLDNLRTSCYIAPARRSLRVECKGPARFEGIPEFFQA